MKDILELLKNNKLAELRKVLIEENPIDIAETFDYFPKDKAILIFKLLPKDISADVFTYMSDEKQLEIIQNITEDELTYIINEMQTDDTVDLLEELPANIVSKILKNIPHEKKNLINQLLKYNENSAGSVMLPEHISLKKNMTVKEALIYFKKNANKSEKNEIFFVTDNKRLLDGFISLKDLVLADNNELIEDKMNTSVISVSTFTDQEEVASLFRKYDVNIMPVVDSEKRMVGVITIDDVVDVIDKENTEDFQIMAAMNPSDEDYLKESIFSLAKHRIIWLLVLMISATLTGTVIRKYENTLQTVVILTAFIPMLMDTGGNAGSQSSTLIIRGMALNKIKPSDLFKVIWKEFRVSILVGVILAIVNFFRIYYLDKIDVKIAFVVSISMLLTIVIAKVIGGILPIIAKSLKLDPAIMASPLITTIVDVAALMVYFKLSVLILGLE